MYHSGRTFMTYSASNCAGTGYKLGLIELTGSDPLSPSSWTKASAPVFQTANGYGYCASYGIMTLIFGLRNDQPGHNGFFLSPSSDIYMVYHANSVIPGMYEKG